MMLNAKQEKEERKGWLQRFPSQELLHCRETLMGRSDENIFRGEDRSLLYFSRAQTRFQNGVDRLIQGR
jgi:hypothetical protein